MSDDGLGRESRADSELDQAMSGGLSQSVGQFRFYIDGERWEWSDEVQQLHGYRPGELPNPTTEQVLSHKHPDDYAHVLGALDDTRRTRVAFSTRHRMIDTAGNQHQVVVVGAQLRDDAGTVVGTQGFYVDITPGERVSEDRVTAKVSDIVVHREVIDQAKGMLMLLYGIDAAAAYGLLRWRSQESNVKLRVLAQQLLADFRDRGGVEVRSRSAYDELLMTAHDRVTDASLTGGPR